MPDIIVRSRKTGGKVPLIKASLVGIGTRIHAVAEAIFGIQLKAAAKIVPEPGEERVEAGGSVVGIVRHAIDQAVECQAASCAHVVKIVVLGKVSGGAALVSERSHPLSAKVVLRAQCVVVSVGGRPVRGEGRQIDAAVDLAWAETTRQGQVVAGEREDGVGIGGITIGIVHVRGEAIDVENLAAAETLAIIHEWRIEAAIQRVGLHEAVIGHAEAAANDQAITELVVHDFSRAPGETQLRAKIALLGIIERPAGTNPDVGKNIGAGAENDRSKLAILLRDGSKIF